MNLISKLNARRMALASKKRKGFTMVEMVIVIVIIAVLMAALIPTFATVVQNAQTSAATQAMKSSYEAIKAYDLHDNGYLDGAANGIIVYKANDTTKGYIALVTDGEMSDVYIVEQLAKDSTALKDGGAFTYDGTDSGTFMIDGTNDKSITLTKDGFTNVTFGNTISHGDSDTAAVSAGSSVLNGTLVDVTENVCFYNVGEGAVDGSDDLSTLFVEDWIIKG